MRTVTADDVKNIMIGAERERVDTVKCDTCGYMQHFYRHEEELSLHTGCNCEPEGWKAPAPATWQDLADFVNKQGKKKSQDSILLQIGYTEDSL